MRQGYFLDVGVNLGQTLVKVKIVDPSRQYVGFEPNPACVAYVQELLKVNDYQDSVVIPVGLYTEDTVRYMDLYGRGSNSSASLIPNFRRSKEVCSRIFVPVFRFESLSDALPKDSVGVIKIDVEGAELEVAKSLIGTIERERPVVLLEVLPVYSVAGRERMARQEALERIFRAVGYSLFRVKKTGSGSYAGVDRIESIGIHSDLSKCDYVLTPRELGDVSNRLAASEEPVDSHSKRDTSG